MLRGVKLWAAIAVVALGHAAHADETMAFPTRDGGADRVDAGFFAGLPPALPAGLEPGLAVGVAHAMRLRVRVRRAAHGRGHHGVVGGVHGERPSTSARG